MRKIFKIILAIFAVIIIVVVAFAAIILFDVAAYTATGSQTLTPSGTSVGKAIVIYDPGLSGTAKGVADKVASDLQTKGYTVTEAGIKSSAASNTTDYGIIVVGGPVYAGALTSSIKDNLNSIDRHGQGTKVGVLEADKGQQLQRTLPRSSNQCQLVQTYRTHCREDWKQRRPKSRAQDFVNQLTS